MILLPSAKLSDLLVVLTNGTHGKRRMYACAILKRLASDPYKRPQLIQTRGVMASLFHVVNDELSSDKERAFASEALVVLLSQVDHHYRLPDNSPIVSQLLTFVDKNKHLFREYGRDDDDYNYSCIDDDNPVEYSSTMDSLMALHHLCSASRDSAVRKIFFACCHDFSCMQS